MTVRRPIVIVGGKTSELPAGDSIDKSLVGLGNADNTSDAVKPVSTPQANALALKANDADTLSYKGAIPSAADLDTYLNTGIFVCPSNANAAAGSHFPTAAAGKLSVVNYGTGTFIWQRYERYQTGQSYHRAYYPATGGWSAWVTEWDSTSLDPTLYALLSGANFTGPITVGTDSLTVDTTNDRIGVGVATPLAGLHVSGTAAGIRLSRTHATQEPFIQVISNESPSNTGAQVRGLLSGGVRFTSGDASVEFLRLTGASNRPGADNSLSTGEASFRWSVVYSATGSINTSDAREKTPVEVMTASELAAANEMADAIGTYQWLSSIEQKGAQARSHAGLTVQRAIEIMEGHGLDPFSYGFICHDFWEEIPELWADIPEVVDEEGHVVQEASRELQQPYRPAGDLFSFRHDELLLFIARGAAASRAEQAAAIADLSERLSALEGMI